MIVAPDPIDDRTIGQRLRTARRTAGLTQARAADAIGVARTTLIAIEQGRRRVRTRELQELSFRYGTSPNAILRREAVHLDWVPQFRKLLCDNDLETASEEAARTLTFMVSAELELEDALGVRRHRNYPRERRILPGDVGAQAEQDAQELRDWLGLGPGPVRDIVGTLDLDLGIRVYLRRLEGEIAGLFKYDDVAGACLLLNASHPAGRRAHAGARGLAHFIASRREPAILSTDSPRNREGWYADSFARALLMPARAVKQRFGELTAGQTHLTRRHVTLLCQCFEVSRDAMVRRLEELGLAREGTWDWFRGLAGVTTEQADRVREAPFNKYGEGSVQPDPVPPRLALLAREAWKRMLYSEGELAELLRLHRLDLRRFLDGVETEMEEADDLLELSG